MVTYMETSDNITEITTSDLVDLYIEASETFTQVSKSEDARKLVTTALDALEAEMASRGWTRSQRDEILTADGVMVVDMFGSKVAA